MSASRRSFLAGSLGVAALGAVAACGSSSDDNGGKGSGGSVTGAPTKDPKDIKGEILIWDFANEKLDEKEDPLFNAVYPNIKLTHVAQPGANYTTLLQTALRSPNGPDVCMLHAGAELTTFSPALLDVTSMITKEQKDNLIGWETMSPDFDASKGIFGLPFQLSGGTLFYNKALLSQAGLDATKPPTNWADFLAACDKLKQAGIVAVSMGDKEVVMPQFWFGWIQPAFMTPEECKEIGQGKVKWSESDKVKEVWQAYFDFCKKGYFQSSWRTDGIFAESVDRFNKGQAAFNYHLNNFASIYYTSLKDDCGVVVTQGKDESSPKAKYLNASAGLTFAVTKKTKYPEAAYAWGAWKTSKARQESDLAELSTENLLQAGRLPTDKRVSPDANAYPVVKDMVEGYKFTPVAGSSLGYAKAQVATALMQTAPSVYDGRKSVDDLCKALDDAQAS